MKSYKHPKQWYEWPCPDPHPPGHCRLCLVFYADIDGERWNFPDDDATMNVERASKILTERAAQHRDEITGERQS